GAAATPVHELAADNIRRFEEANKGPGFKERLKAGAAYMRLFTEDSDRARTIIRKNLGNETRDAFQAKQAMAAFRKTVNSASEEDKIGLLKWLQDPDAKLSHG